MRYNIAMRILSGINPSSSKGLHIGNYFGAVKRFVELQSMGECFFFVANLHSLNTVHNPEEVRANAHNVFVEYLALGLDPEKSTFYVESDIPEIPYLQTILNNVVTVAELQRMHGYKDKLVKDVDQSQLSAGLFEYPVLMAADILLFDTDVVPVGEDQVQHVEVTREIARTFNNRYGSVLKLPDVEIQRNTARIIGTDGQRKMSKSLGNDLPIFAEEKVIHDKIMSITTDPARIRPTDPGDPAKNICFTYLALLNFDAKELAALEDKYRAGTVGDVEIKKLLFGVFMEYFKSHREKKEQIAHSDSFVSDIRAKGALRARSFASEKLKVIKTHCGV